MNVDFAAMYALNHTFIAEAAMHLTQCPDRMSAHTLTGLSIDGRVATPSDPDWDGARRAWNLAADLHPAAVAFAESADDVARAIRFAAEGGLKVAG